MPVGERARVGIHGVRVCGGGDEGVENAKMLAHRSRTATVAPAAGEAH